MSSISAADRKSQTEEVRSQREEAQNREAEEAKKHKKEIKRLLERQAEEVEGIKDTFGKQVDTLRKRSTEQLSERDQENQAKITQLKAMYLESLKKKTDESENRRQAETESYKSQLSKQRQVTDQQRETLSRNFENSIRDRDRNFEDLTTQSRGNMKEAINRQGEKLTNKHESEMKHLIDDRDGQMAQSYRDLKNSKSAYENRLKDQKRNSDYKLEQTDSTWRTNYENKTGEMSGLLVGKSEELQLVRDHMQNNYNKALEAKLESMGEAGETLKEQVHGRIDRDVRSLESENARIKNSKVVEMMTTKRMRDLEKSHVIQDYESRMDNLAKTKDGLVEVGKEVNRRKIEQAVKKNDQILSDTNRRNHTDMIIANERHKEDRDRLELESKSQLRRVGDKTKERVDKIMKVTADAQRSEQRQHNENVGALRNSYSEELSNQRQAQMEQLKDTYLRMDEKLKNTEEKYSRKLDETVGGYEAKISEMQEKYEKELDRQASVMAVKSKDREKAHQMDLKTSEIKTEMKLGQLAEAHEKEIQRLDRRHQEQMAALAQKLSYYRKNT